MKKRTILRLRDPLHRPVRIFVKSGVVVVTRRGDPGDHVVKSGQTLTLHPLGLTTITAVSLSAVVEIADRHLTRTRTVRLGGGEEKSRTAKNGVDSLSTAIAGR